ncbi:MAG: hypothetical protein C0456_02810 [Hyphomonas sp.]|uniref:SDR family NAD(P)-dependent oxidoreductase n=1 Tax=Hyphomonas sp. TaxID=87 RepID=UPI001D4682DF|nr:SDR family oxidoreductase [Hyphomonas sp.]MBA4225537.1 hypothetical protein [Hyphomonas sp.]
MAQPVTLVLGLGRETGEAIARRFEDEGHRVLVADPSLERIETARDTLDEAIQFYHGDLSTKLGLRNAVTAAIEAFGRIDHAVIVPPYEDPDTLLDLAQEKFEKALGRSARGAALALRVVAERLLEQEDLPETGVERKRQKGSVTFILRYAAQASMPGRFTDTVAQAAVQGVMRAGALELAEHAIRVNAIVSLRPSEERATPWSLGRVPLGRAVLADEIAGAAYFLASRDAAFMTGQSLIMDGGRATLSGVLD